MKEEITVWVGFVDDAPHIFSDENGDRIYAVYPTQSQARELYQDVRGARLVYQRVTKNPSE